MSLYTDMVAAGVPVSNWQSDLYVPVNDTTREILNRHPLARRNATVFRNNEDDKPWYDIPFNYEPYWDRRAGRRPHDFYDREDDLAHCKVCGGAEGSLPTHCPNRHMPGDLQDAVYAGQMDYREGRWVSLKPVNHPGYISYYGQPMMVTDDFGNATALTTGDDSTLEQWVYSISGGTQDHHMYDPW